MEGMLSYHNNKMNHQNRAVESVVQRHKGVCLNELCCHRFTESILGLSFLDYTAIGLSH